VKTYAHVMDGVVVEIISPMTYEFESLSGTEPAYKAGDEIPISQRFSAEFVSALVDVTALSPQPSSGMIYSGGTFSNAPPVPLVSGA
jgi:hypothetical protein